MEHHSTPVSRRALLRASGVAGVAALSTRASVPAQTAPQVPVPDTAEGSTLASGTSELASGAHAAVMWGSSSADSFRSEYPVGQRKITVYDELTALGIPTIRHAFGGWKSPEILAMRSKDHPIKPRYDFAGANGQLPGSGTIILPTSDGIVPGTVTRAVPGTISGHLVSLQAAAHRYRKVLLTRQDSGAPVQVGTGSRGYWRTALADLERGKIHMLWMGKNNSSQVQRVLADTRAAYDVEPARTLVMGHWFTWWDRVGTAGHTNLTAINDGYRRTYARKYFDTMAALWDSQWWSLPELRDLALGSSADSVSRRNMGLPPQALVHSDTYHLNSYGYLIIAHALAAKLRALGWV